MEKNGHSVEFKDPLSASIKPTAPGECQALEKQWRIDPRWRGVCQIQLLNGEQRCDFWAPIVADAEAGFGSAGRLEDR